MRKATGLASLLGVMLYTAGVAAPNYFIYVGTYTENPDTGAKNDSKGIYAYRYDPDKMKLVPLGAVGEMTNPTFLAADSKWRHLYALSEASDGSVHGFQMDRKTGKLSPTNVATGVGDGPCHVSVDHTGKLVFAANYGKGSLAAIPIEPDGKLGQPAIHEHSGSSVDKNRQAGPHAHEAVIAPDNRFVFVPDLGLDQVKIYRIDAAQGTVTPGDPPFVKIAPGSGPRHLSFDPPGKFAYVLSELTPTITVLAYEASAGTFHEIQTIPSMAPASEGENGPAEIEVDRSGKYVYASNRGPNTIGVFAIDAGSGMLRQIQVQKLQGSWPRHFAIDPSGKYLFVGDQKSDLVEIFAIDSATGKLSTTEYSLHVTSPVDILFVPAL